MDRLATESDTVLIVAGVTGDVMALSGDLAINPLRINELTTAILQLQRMSIEQSAAYVSLSIKNGRIARPWGGGDRMTVACVMTAGIYSSHLFPCS